MKRILRRLRVTTRRFLTRIDPCDEPGAPRTPYAFMVCFGVLFAITTWVLVRNKYLPGTDMPYHALASRIWMDAGDPSGPYARYEPRHLLEANTALYTTVSTLAHVFGHFTAYRIANAWYFLGVPVACLYALRSFARPLWGSLLGFPVCYNEAFSSGYLNFNFGAPFLIFAVVEYLRFARRPTFRRGILVACLFLAAFLSHAQVYLWLGALVMVLTVVGLQQRFARTDGFVPALRKTGWLALLCGLVSAPSLAVFYSWYAHTYGQGRAVGGEFKLSSESSFSWLPLVGKMTGGATQSLASSLLPNEYHYILAMGIVVALAWGLSRARTDASSIPEVLLVLTIGSYFVLPDYVSGQYTAPRQWYVAGWLLPITVVPLAVRLAPARSLVCIAAILAFTGLRMHMIIDAMVKLNDEEMKGLDKVAATAPKEPGLMITYAAIDPSSKYFKTSYGHAYAFVAAERGYDSPLDLVSDKNSVAPVRYTDGLPLPIARSFSNPTWYLDNAIWRYDLVLVRRWAPTHDQRLAARERADLVAASDDWELWRRRGPPP